jgi:hypothetical protein
MLATLGGAAFVDGLDDTDAPDTAVTAGDAGPEAARDEAPEQALEEAVDVEEAAGLETAPEAADGTQDVEDLEDSAAEDADADEDAESVADEAPGDEAHAQDRATSHA